MSFLPHVLLGLAICAVWAPAVPLSAGRWVIAPWALLLAGAVFCGLSGGALDLRAAFSVAALAVFSWAAVRAGSPLQRGVFSVAATLLALAMALHGIPGFDNPVLVAEPGVGGGPRPFVLRAHFDKGAGGLFLLVFFCRRVERARELRHLAPRAAAIALGVPVLVLGTAWATGWIRPDPRWPAFAPAFLAVNLLFTCVAEEAFFRGLLQERLMRVMPSRPWIPAGCCAVLFGLAHAPGGAMYVVMATVAGAGYGWMYARTRRIEAAVFVHFMVNAASFFLVTRPAW